MLQRVYHATVGDKQLAASRRQQVYEYVRDFTAEHEYPPTQREIADGLGISSLAVVNWRLAVLAREGKLVPAGRTSRGYRLPVMAKSEG